MRYLRRATVKTWLIVIVACNRNGSWGHARSLTMPSTQISNYYPNNKENSEAGGPLQSFSDLKL